MTPAGRAQLLELPAREQRIVSDGVAARLRDQPASPSRAIKPLRPYHLTDDELWPGDLRVFYKVDPESTEVVIVIVGRKVGDALIVEGEEFRGHEGDPAE